MKMLLVVFLCFQVAIVTEILADSFITYKKLDELNTDNERIAELEEQVAVLQEIIGVRQNGTLQSLRGYDSVIRSVSRDCQELFLQGFTENGVYSVSPDGRCPFSVFCDMTNGGWTMIQRRQDGRADFRRNWTEYVQGFGDLEGDHWLGLDKIHRLTHGGSQIHFSLLSHDFMFNYSFYPSFTVHDVMSGYRMNVDPYGYEGTEPELLSYHNDMRFSTYDRDNDQYSGSCSENYGGGSGWWFRSCYRLGVLNGEYGKRNLAGMRIWDKEDKYVLNSVIKVKPRMGMC